MGKYIIHGGRRLSGEVFVNGAKNAILPIMAASILLDGESVLHNVPAISDMFVTVDILKALGCRVSCEKNTCVIDSSFACRYEVPEEMVKKMRSSIVFLGALLGRFGSARLAYPGGCEIGARPIDLHLKALKKMGVCIEEEEGFLSCHVKRLYGARINLDFPSVGATENIMLAAVKARGRTVIYNAAREPEIVDLQRYLEKAGAKVSGAGTDTIVIDGVERLLPVEHTALPDRIEAGTYLAAAAVTGGEVMLRNIDPDIMRQVVLRFMDTGCIIKEEKNGIFLRAPEALLPIDRIKTQPYPGFPTDLQPQMMSVLTLAEGTSIIIETVFEARFKHIVELCKMGADITFEGYSAVVKGVPRLLGAHVTAYDLRGGAALIVAGLSAYGETTVANSCYVERGYAHIEHTLTGLGADIVLTKGTEEKDDR